MIAAGAVIQARMLSTRLPGKVMRLVQGVPMILHVVRRVRCARRVGEVVVATTTDPSDDGMAGVLEAAGVRVFRGSMHDVLDRYYQAARHFDMAHVVRITADCPLIDGAVIDQVIGAYEGSGADYASNVLQRTFPDGQDVEVFSAAALERSWRAACQPREREHVTVHIRQHPEIFRLLNVVNGQDWSRKRWTLDHAEDLSLIEAVMDHFLPEGKPFGMRDIAAFLEQHPELEALNSHHIK